MGGICDEDELRSAGESPIENLWSDPSMARQIVRITASHPKPKLRGLRCHSVS
jgi:hypothetical protein